MKKLSIFLLTFFASTLLIPLTRTYSAKAVTASDWKAGRIIDDGVFVNKDSMSVYEIQQFLNSKVPLCDSNGSQLTSRVKPGGGYYTRAEWGALVGNPAPFTCLRDYYEIPKTTPSPGVPANNYGGKPIPSGGVSAAQLIWDAGQTFRISPKVLLTTIQKESYGPLTVDDWPYQYQYTYAMGAQCPDGANGANCDPNYAGFSIQIRESARLFRYYLDNMSQPWWPYKKPNQVNFVLWQVAVKNGQPTNCGGSNVFIETAATAALYTYTPYQPNQAALSNMSGEGDYCSAYGNRNFWRIFNDWFGSTQIETCFGNETPLPYVRRFYNPRTFMQFYSALDCDVAFLEKIGFINEGPVFNTTSKQYPWAVPIYRYYNPETRIHFWSATYSTPEELAASGTGYRQEAGIVFYVASTQPIAGLHPVTRFYNPYTYINLWVPNAAQDTKDFLLQRAGFLEQGTPFYTQ